MLLASMYILSLLATAPGAAFHSLIQFSACLGKSKSPTEGVPRMILFTLAANMLGTWDVFHCVRITLYGFIVAGRVVWCSAIGLLYSTM